MDDRLLEVRRFWDRAASVDPMWAILSDPARAGGRWRLQEFMENGEREIALLWHQLAQLGLPVQSRVALDFGCGIGRTTEALARRFQSVAGLDISSVMIGLARRIGRYPGTVTYRWTTEAPLSERETASCDFVYSNIVLQHVPPDFARAYVADFLRVLRPGGVLVFQLPSHQNLGANRIRAMEDGAYRAGLTFVEPPPTEIQPAASGSLHVAVRNDSPHVWDQPSVGSVQIGNHWLDAQGARLLIQDDGRAVLPQQMRPGDRERVRLTVNAPKEPGTYVCEVDVVHEGVAWFEGKGSSALRAIVRVADDGPPVPPSRGAEMIQEYPIPEYAEPTTSLLPDTAPETEAREGEPFLMCGIPRHEVLRFIAQHGGVVRHAEEDLRAMPEWLGYRYFIRKHG